MAPQASKKCGLLPPDHRHIGINSCTSNSIDSEQVPGTFSAPRSHRSLDRHQHKARKGS
jgi:hypothetical protein